MAYDLYNFKLKQSGASINYTPISKFNEKIKKSGDGIPYNEQMISSGITSGQFTCTASTQTANARTDGGADNSVITSFTGGIIGRDPSYQYNTLVVFQNVTIPQGSEIDSCYIKVHCQQAFSGTVATDMYFQNADTASMPATWGQFLALSLTGAVRWTISVDWAEGYYDTPELKTILQTVIDRPGFSSGNNIMFVTKYLSGYGYAWRHYDHSGFAPYVYPVLYVDYRG